MARNKRHKTELRKPSVTVSKDGSVRKNKRVSNLQTKQLNEIIKEIRWHTENGKQKNGNYSTVSFIWNF